MAKETAKKEAASEAEAASAAKPAGGKSLMRVALVVVAVTVLEVGTVVVTMMMNKGPSPAHANEVEPGEDATANQSVEIQVIKDQFPNQQTGRTYLYDTEIFITVKQKDAEKVKKVVETMQAGLSTDVAVVFRRADPSMLTEPTLATLTRQVKSALDHRLGEDAEGKPVVQEVLVKKCIQFRTDG